MTRSLYKILGAVLWLAPVAVCIRYWQLWDRLPMRVATHFNAAGRANGWMTREMSLYYSAGFLALLAGVFFVVLTLIARKYALGKLAWALLAFFHAEIWTFAYMLNSMLEFNLSGRQIAISPVAVVSAVGACVIAGLAVADKRGTPLASTEILAEEVHAGKKWAAILLLASLAFVPVVLVSPNPTVRVAMGALAVILVAAFAMAWDGFHYYFTRHGVEIRTLGFRLKSIPLLQIKNYEIQSWSPVRGYGIRGVGNCKAYVWGNTGVRVELYDGTIFLGHSDPQRIVHDLNVIKRFQHL
ncbi:MAG: DUF1648 domain-containing protein [Candidatus Sulfotelmatobacter sp.]